MLILRTIISFSLTLLAAVAVFSQSTGVAPGGGRVAARPADLTLGKLASTPNIDGVFSEGEWNSATRAELNFQIEPGDNLPASEKTEVFLACDREYLYLGFRAYDSDPSGIRGRVVKRDDVCLDDYVSLYLDTYNDGQRAYHFAFNPLGIQLDGVYTTDRQLDLTWDGILESKGALTADGYVVEAAIPFRTIRFRAGKEAQWGLHLRRWIARKSERASWQPISRDVSSLLVQMGALAGLDEIYAGRTLDLIPTLTGSINGERRARDWSNNAARSFSNSPTISECEAVRDNPQ